MMKKTFSMVIIMVFMVAFDVCACNGVTVHSGYIWDDYGCIIDFLDEGVEIDILEPSSVFPERTNICINGTIGSFYTDYLSYYDYYMDYSENFESFGNIEVHEDLESSEDYEAFEMIEDLDYSLLTSTGIYSRVTADLVLRDMNNMFISVIPCGELVEVLRISPIDPNRMVVNYGGFQGTVLACYIEQTYADNIETYFCPEDEETYCPTGIYSRVTGNLVIRDENYCPIGLVPKGELVEVIQLSRYYPERMEIVYDGLYGSVLSCFIEHTYADNL